ATRRNRLMSGNIEWIRLVLPRVFKRNLLVGLIALRRVFRVFWGYWVSLLVIGCAFTLARYFNEQIVFIDLLIASLALCGTLALFTFCGDLLAAFSSSLRAPFRLWSWSAVGHKEIAWK